MDLDKFPPIIVFPFVLIAAIALGLVYLIVIIARMFMWGKPAKFIDDIFDH